MGNTLPLSCNASMGFKAKGLAAGKRRGVANENDHHRQRLTLP